MTATTTIRLTPTQSETVKRLIELKMEQVKRNYEIGTELSPETRSRMSRKLSELNQIRKAFS